MKDNNLICEFVQLQTLYKHLKNNEINQAIGATEALLIQVTSKIDEPEFNQILNDTIDYHSRCGVI